MTVQAELDGLQASLNTVYPGVYGDAASRPGTVTATVALDRVAWDDAPCAPWPCEVRATVVLLAAQAGPVGARDLGGHVEPAAALVRAAGWQVDEAQPAAVDDLPALELTVTTTTTE